MERIAAGTASRDRDVSLEFKELEFISKGDFVAKGRKSLVPRLTLLLSEVSGLMSKRSFTENLSTNCLWCWFSHSRNKVVQESAHLKGLCLYPGYTSWENEIIKTRGLGGELCRDRYYSNVLNSNSERHLAQKIWVMYFFYKLPRLFKYFRNFASAPPPKTIAPHPILCRKEILDNILNCCLKDVGSFVSRVINRVTNCLYFCWDWGKLSVINPGKAPANQIAVTLVIKKVNDNDL